VLACVIFLIIASIGVTASDLITGEVIGTGEVIATGEAIASGFGLTVFVGGVPALVIVHPENKTYLVQRLLLNYTVGGSPSLNYSIDGGGNNVIAAPTNITFAEGTRNVQMWADGGSGSSTKNVTFTVNKSLLVINYSNYNGSKRGASTKFYSYAFEDLQVLDGVVLENTDYAKIAFTDTINVSDDMNTSDRFVDIDTNVVLNTNSVTVNSTALPNFNKNATVSLYGVGGFTTPQILRNGAVCPSSICTIQSYVGSTLIFTVTQFTTYSAREKPSTPTEEPGGGGGGGGGGGETLIRDFDIISPGPMEIGQDDQIVIPITFSNLDSIPFTNIRISATPSDPNMNAIFEVAGILEILPGANRTLMLFIDTNSSELGEYEIEIIADVGDPAFVEKETIYLKTVEAVGKAEVIERIILAQELFRENPECLELNDLLIKAESLVVEGAIAEARELVQETIFRCRDLLTNKEYPSPPNFSKFAAWRTPIEIALILIVITLIIVFFFRRQKLNLRRGRSEKKKKGFFKRIFGGGRKRAAPKKKRKKAVSDFDY